MGSHMSCDHTHVSSPVVQCLDYTKCHPPFPQDLKFYHLRVISAKAAIDCQISEQIFLIYEEQIQESLSPAGSSSTGIKKLFTTHFGAHCSEKR